jgi:exodeoxyribonuclease-3
VQIATWNVNSVIARLPLVVRWLESARPDVVCLQETKCTDEKFPHSTFAELGYHTAHWGAPAYNGVAILSCTPLEDVQRGFGLDGGSELDVQPRLITGIVADAHIVNVYIPNGQAVGSEKYAYKLRWLEQLHRFFDENFGRDDQIALCGDFNVAPEDRDVHDPILWRGKILCSEPERAGVDELKEWGLIDSFRLHTAEAGHFSWWDYRGGDYRRNAGLRIDHIWVSEPLADRSTRTWIDKEPRAWERPSDHTPVVAEFRDE